MTATFTCDLCGEIWRGWYHFCEPAASTPQNAHSAKSETAASGAAPRAGRPDRPNLEKIREERFGPQGFRYADRSPVLLSVLDHAASLERELTAARHALKSARHSLELIRDAGGSSADRCEAEMALKMMDAAEGIR